MSTFPKVQKPILQKHGFCGSPDGIEEMKNAVQRATGIESVRHGSAVALEKMLNKTDCIPPASAFTFDDFLKAETCPVPGGLELDA